MKLERRFSEIGDLIQKLGTGTGASSEQPTLSIAHAKTSKILILQFNAALMRNAEVGQRRWSSIGVDEWIQAGRWWLMKVGLQRVEFMYYCADQYYYSTRQAQMTLAQRADPSVPRQGFVDLIKASWILIDVIARHPQLNLLDSVVRCEVELLAEVGT